MKTLFVFFVVALAAAYGGLIGAPLATSVVATRQLALGPTAVGVAAPIGLGAPLLTKSIIAGPAIATPIGLGGIGLGGVGLGGVGLGGVGLGGVGLGGTILGKGLCC
ncbi:hypothetical protein NQ315_007531 [Exocentrus adspersus]|uniref:Elastin n=1 Tax=Exocentrus adspersus TaxID=1586481 RepID=A0AAV8W7F6_9CUCU|nr:hypothetical protein NQ315_007531 [Exocentrus adspersus]